MGFYKNRKMRFSQRNGMTSVRDQIQIDKFDEGTRNAIWNEVLMYLESVRNRLFVINRVRVDVFEFALDSQPVIHKYNSLYRQTSEYRVAPDEWLKDKILRAVSSFPTNVKASKTAALFSSMSRRIPSIRPTSIKVTPKR